MEGQGKGRDPEQDVLLIRGGGGVQSSMTEMCIRLEVINFDPV